MNIRKIDETMQFIKSLYPDKIPVPLHAPRFLGNEKKYLLECIDTTYVSYVGDFVIDFEEHIKNLTGARYAVAMVNGTAAIHMLLTAAGIGAGDEVITQTLTFAATAAGIKHSQAEPAFVDVDMETLGMSPESLRAYLCATAERDSRGLFNKTNGRRISAVMPMHTFGHPVKIDEIAAVCEEYNIPLFEDAAESLGSKYKGNHTGTFGKAAVISFNGNKPVTTGGGGMVITDDEELASRIRHISTTAKRKHRWEFYHDEVGYNLRLPNLNAAVGCAQMEYFDQILMNKRETASRYESFFKSQGTAFFTEPPESDSNYWLNAIILRDRAERDAFLEYSNDHGVQTRPVWTLLHKLPPYINCPRSKVDNAEWLEDRVVNIPSGVRI
ncbi:MAG: LegC family aminotransferase [Spirochaetia bacterium]|jgi:aminotransferase in exopolysaccharide biosynthesis|uniref:GDP-perosamine synthase n=1 Tax=bioreactor metagenome TaxID=1076179 RepID=A0A644TUR2_9ZZZZ|nr:LegC family aminotransferase [Spirochaetia bacterium]MCE1209331.1 LegC family aminotransferase [Spirochaetia bacterium]